MSITRRAFFRNSFRASLGALAAGHLFARATPPTLKMDNSGKYGALKGDTQGILEVPEGFSYTVLSREGELMSDGFYTPGAFDGMAAFPGPNNTTILVRNHELKPNDPRNPYGKDLAKWDDLDPERAYNKGTKELFFPGGTSTLIYDNATKKCTKQFLSLAGTIVNCAGGPTPWGSWISCEEVITPRDDARFPKAHGYCFEVRSGAGGLEKPIPLKGMGRFRHEAIAIDPNTGIVYLTEDDWSSCIYRYIPKNPRKLEQGGRLQALVIKDKPTFDTTNHNGETMKTGVQYPVAWIDVDPDPKEGVHQLAQKDGAAVFCRGEGIAYGSNTIYFTCTQGGSAKQGQVFRYRPGKLEGKPDEGTEPGQLELFLEPNDTKIMAMCDNICVAPNGDITIAEDSGQVQQRLLGLTPEGEVYTIAANVMNSSEFAGCTWSPDGKTLFANIQNPGVTLAITGPWK